MRNKKKIGKIVAVPILVIMALVLVPQQGAIALLGDSGTDAVKLQKGLVGWWSFDGDAKDKTPYANNGTLNGNAAVTAADRKNQSNKAATFDGTGDYVSIPDSANWDLGGTFTISAWVYFNTVSTYTLITTTNAIDSSYYTPGWYFSYRGDQAPKYLSFAYATGPGTWSISATANWTASTSTWYHVVVTRDSSNDIKFYVDGAQVGSATNNSTSVTSGSQNLFIAGIDGGSATSMNGRIDDVRIYKRNLSTAEITALYESYNPGLYVSSTQKGLVGWWALDSDTKDKTPNANNGALNGTSQTTDRKGQSNKARSFNGTSSDYISVADSNSLDATQITISAWVKTSGTNDYSGIVNKYDAFGNTGYSLGFGTGGGVRADFGNGTTYIAPTYSATNVEDGAWHHIVATYDGTTARIYVDTTAGSAPTGSGYSTANSLVVLIGRDSYDSGNRTLNGSLDDVRIYNRALSTTEITALYESYDPGIKVSTLQKGMVGNWTLDGDAKDRTPYASHGTVTAASLTTDRKSQSNKAYSFDGSTAYLDAGNNSIFNLTSGFTLAAWVNETADTSFYHMIISKDDETTANKQMLFQFYITSSYTGSKLSLMITDNNNAAYIGRQYSTVFPSGWHHVIATWDGSAASSGVKLYLDGAQVDDGNVASGVFGAARSVTSPVLIGAMIGTNGLKSQFFKGSIDDVRVYNRVLSSTEITALYESYK